MKDLVSQQLETLFDLARASGGVPEIQVELSNKDKRAQFDSLKERVEQVREDSQESLREGIALQDQLYDMCDAYFGHEFDTEEGGLCLTCGMANPYDLADLYYDDLSH